MKRPDMLILIVVWQFFSAVGAIIGIAAVYILVYPIIMDHVYGIGRKAAIFSIWIGALMLACMAIVSIASAIGLLIRREWGRMLSIVHAALSLLLVPIGTIIGVLIIQYLGKPEVKEYFQPQPAAE
jgi:hypothetical protein